MMMAASPSATDDSDLDLILSAGEEAGRIAMGYFRDDPEVWYKNNGTSPVSAADIAVDSFLKDVLLSARPDFGWLSEETADSPERLAHDRLFVVDPIDGTRAFIAGEKTWCVSIAIVAHGQTRAGVLIAPALGDVFSVGNRGPAIKNGRALPVITHDVAADALKFAAPQSMISSVARRLPRPVEKVPHVPSLAYRLAMVADGRLDATLVKPKARDWDIAAADLLLSRVGGDLLTLGGTPIVYNRPETDHGVLIAASGALTPELVGILGNPNG